MHKSEAALIAARRTNLAALRSRGRDPFAQTRYDVNARAADIRERWDEGTRYRLAGRVMSKRGTGKTLFVDLHDRSGRIQLYIRKDELG